MNFSLIRTFRIYHGKEEEGDSHRKRIARNQSPAF